MEIHGKLNLVNSEVKSDEFASDKQFNKIVVNSLSEVDQGTLDHDVIIFNKEDDNFYTYDRGSNSWKSYLVEINQYYDINETSAVYIDDVQDVYNQVNLVGSDNDYIYIDKDLFDFGPIGSPIDFVIDFWLKGNVIYSIGTILYNGQKTGQVDLEQNKNLLITTSGVTLVKDPNYQDNPIFIPQPYSSQYLNIFRPQLKSTTNIIHSYMTHVALIRSGDTTYLAINGKIEDSAPSVEYFHYDDVLIGAGYFGSVNYGIVNLRVTKNTDLGWTTDFTPPNHNIIPDANTDFLMDSTSLVDTMGNHDVVVNGDIPTITQDRFYYQLPIEYNGCRIKTTLSQDKCVFKLPSEDTSYSFIFDVDDTPFELISKEVDINRNTIQAVNFNTDINTLYYYYRNNETIITYPQIIPTIRSTSSLILPYTQDILYADELGLMKLVLLQDSPIPAPSDSYSVSSVSVETAAIIPTSYQFYSTSGHDYLSSGSYVNWGDDLFIIDFTCKFLVNEWAIYLGIYAANYWDVAGYSSSYNLDIRCGGINNVDNVLVYNANDIGDWFHIIFSFYRGDVRVHSRNINNTTTYTTREQSANTSQNNFRHYLYSRSNIRYSYIRTQRISGILTDNDVDNFMMATHF